MFDLCAGFVYSQVLLACVELGVFERLADGPLSLDALATPTALTPEAMHRLIDAAVSLDLLEWRALRTVGLGPLGATLVGNVGVLAMIEHHRLFYDDVRDPVALLRGPHPATALSRFWSYAGTAAHHAVDDAQAARYSALMSASQTLIAHDVLDCVDVRRVRRLLDVGGGDGTFAATALQRAPALHATVFDIPQVAQRAQARFERDGVHGRARAIGGDFRVDPLPNDADLLSFVRVLHDHDDPIVAAVLGRAYEALAPGGRLLIAEPMAATRGAEPMGAAYFGLYLLAMGQGRPRTARELEALLRTAGFVDVQRIETPQPLQVSILTAVKR